MSEPRRLPGLGAVVAGLFLLASLVAVGWWQFRPKPDAGPPGPAAADLDVVCIGRIDGLTPVASLEPGLPGRVAKISVSEGDAVKAGQELLRLDDAAARLRVDEAKAAVAGAEVEMDAAKLEVKLHPGRVAAAEGAVSAAHGRVLAAYKTRDERKKQLDFGQISAAEFAAFEAEVKGLEQLEAAEKAKRDELKAADPGLKVRAADAKKAAAEVALKQAEKAVADCVLTAPSAGTVLRIQTSVGEAVAPGTPLAPVIFRPEGPLVVRAELDQEFLGRVRAGMKATVRDDVRADSPVWTGKVLRVGSWVARKRSIVLEPGEINDVRTVECVIALDPSPEPLLVGQRVRVRVSRE